MRILGIFLIALGCVLPLISWFIWNFYLFEKVYSRREADVVDPTIGYGLSVLILAFGCVFIGSTIGSRNDAE